MENLKTMPVVYAVGNNYQIFFVAKVAMLAYVKIGDKVYYDHSNGVIRSNTNTHKIIVPMSVLNKAKKYTLCYKIMNQRKISNSDVGEEVEINFDFRPVENEVIRMYDLTDTHSKIDTPAQAASYNEFDVLVMVGDNPNSAQNLYDFDTIHELAGKVTKGEIPVVFAKGNHDLMGVCAENFAEYTPTDNGKSYYTFRLGDMWGLVLDQGPDKHDDYETYCGTVCGDAFRREETEFIENVIKNAQKEYKAKGVKKRAVFCHVAMTQKYSYPYDVDNELMYYWAKLLREKIKPHMFFSGHDHATSVYYKGGKRDYKGQACPIIMASNPHTKLMNEENIDKFTGGLIVADNKRVTVTYNDNENNITGQEIFNLKTGKKEN